MTALKGGAPLMMTFYTADEDKDSGSAAGIALVVIGYIALVFSVMGVLILGCTGTRPRDLAGGIAEGDTAEMQPIPPA